MPGNKSHVTGERGIWSHRVSNTIRFVGFLREGGRQVRDRGMTTSMSRSFFWSPQVHLLFVLFGQKFFFFLLFPFPLCFLWPFVVVVVFWPLPRFSPFVVAVLLSCPVRTTTKEMDHNFVSVLPAEWMGERKRGNRTEKREKTPNGHTRQRCGCGRGRLCGAPLSYPSPSYSSAS